MDIRRVKTIPLNIGRENQKITIETVKGWVPVSYLTINRDGKSMNYAVLEKNFNSWCELGIDSIKENEEDWLDVLKELNLIVIDKNEFSTNMKRQNDSRGFTYEKKQYITNAMTKEVASYVFYEYRNAQDAVIKSEGKTLNERFKEEILNWLKEMDNKGYCPAP